MNALNDRKKRNLDPMAKGQIINFISPTESCVSIEL